MLTTSTVPFYVQPLTNHYANRRERVEMHVSPEAKHLVPKPAYGHRIGVTVSIGNRDYRGGLRTFQDRTYLCSNLRRASDNKPAKLADLLNDIGVRPRDQISVRINAGKWTITT